MAHTVMKTLAERTKGWCERTRSVIVFTVLLLSWQFSSAADVERQKEIYTPDYHVYHNLADTAFHLRKLAAKHSDIIRIDWTYHSRNNIPQLVTRITNFSLPLASSVDSLYLLEDSKPEDAPKVRLLLSYGEHAREFFPVESFFHLLKNLTRGSMSKVGSPEERFSKMILSRFDIFVVVMANPDGRKIVESSNNYCWRGTSTGVDMNRNFDWQFANKGSSSNPTDEEFRGPYAFSEPECKTYVDLTERVRFDAFVSFHTGARHIYMPFADTASKLSFRDPPNFESLSDLASRLSAATKYKFRYGKAYDLNFYTADGTAFDYMAGKRQIPFSLTIEMWENKQHRGRSCFDEFNPQSQQLKKELEDFHPLYVEMFSYLHQWKLRQFLLAGTMPAAIEAPTLTLNYIMLGAVVCLSLVMVYKNRQYICATKRRIVHLRRLSSTFTMGGIFR